MPNTRMIRLDLESLEDRYCPSAVSLALLQPPLIPGVVPGLHAGAQPVALDARGNGNGIQLAPPANFGRPFEPGPGHFQQGLDRGLENVGVTTVPVVVVVEEISITVEVTVSLPVQVVRNIEQPALPAVTAIDQAATETVPAALLVSTSVAEQVPPVTTAQTVVRPAESILPRPVAVLPSVPTPGTDATLAAPPPIPVTVAVLVPQSANIPAASATARPGLSSALLSVQIQEAPAVPATPLANATAAPHSFNPYLADMVTRLFAEGAGTLDAGLQNVLETMDHLDLPANVATWPTWVSTLLAMSAGLGGAYALFRQRWRPEPVHPGPFDWPKSEPAPWE